MDAITLAKFLAAYATTTGAHTGGHFDEAGKLNIPISLDAKNLVEVYTPNNADERARMGGAGFRMQDKVTQAFDNTEMQTPARMANLLNKTFYLSGLPNMLSSKAVPGGDFGEIDRAKGKNYGREIAAASALFDLAKIAMPEKLKNINMHYDQSKSGTPMFMLSGKF